MASHTAARSRWIESVFIAVFFTSLRLADGAALRINVGGPAIRKLGFSADLSNYLTKQGTATYSPNSLVSASGTWMPVYSHYRYAYSGDLEYNIPLSPGEYKVSLLFAETWPATQTVGARRFDVVINGKTRKPNLDVFAKVGANKPYYLSISKLSPVDGALTITLARIPGAENPMLSGLVIVGDNPTALIKTSTSSPGQGIDNQPANKQTSTNDSTPKNADPKCETGIFGMNKSTGQMACCEKVCGQCGGVNCATAALGKPCCISSVAASSRSCDTALPPCVPSTDPQGTQVTAQVTAQAAGSATIPTTTPVNTRIANPASLLICKNGILGIGVNRELACCPSVCKKCGGAGCHKFAPGTLCCVKKISNLNKSCDSNPPPCVPRSQEITARPESGTVPTCKKGILGLNIRMGKAACCPEECKKCGGANCNKFAPGKQCCILPIARAGKSCATNDPPCVPEASELSTTAPSTSASTTTTVSSTSPTTSATTIPPPSSPPSTSTDMEAPMGTCPITGATKTTFRINIGGGVVPGATMGADNINYVSSNSKGIVFSLPSLKISASSGSKPWDAAYSSHRFGVAPLLSYSIPVPAGKYTINLLFAETYFNEKGKRVFDVLINGEKRKAGLDIFAEVGKNKGLLLAFMGVPSVKGKILVSVKKVLENPMISGIMIEGAGAGDLASGGGCEATEKGSADKSSSAKGSNSGFNHRAHAVPGGPYIATDFEKSGKAFVSIDGTQSHSHYSDPGPPPVTGSIVSYKWKWAEVSNGKSVPMSNSDKSGKFTASFPLGKTILNLEVVDNTGDVATDKTIVEVKNSAENGAYCYFYDFKDSIKSTVPINDKVDSDPRPLYGEPFGTINFNENNLPKIKFSGNAFAIRCVFFIKVTTSGKSSFEVVHNGPFKLFHQNALLASSSLIGETSTRQISLTQGLHAFQLHYFRAKNIAPKLQLTENNLVIPSTTLQHDSAITLPVIESLSKSETAVSGGENIQIYGSGFINGVSVQFGSTDAQNLISSNAGMLQVTVPPGTGTIMIVVRTNAGRSNPFPFTYTSGDTLNQPVIFERTLLKNNDGSSFDISFVAAVTYGPDGRIYLGGTKGKLTALTVNKDLRVTTKCERSIHPTRAILGVAFNPRSSALKMFFTSSTLYWKDFNLMSFEQGWANGKVQAIEWSSKATEDNTGAGQSCAGLISDFVTGLPVSNHDHGANKLLFMPDGKLLISVGSFTNGGISIPGRKPVDGDAEDDALGGVASNPLSAALISCPVNKLIEIKYDNYVDPEKAKVISGKECSLYATGIRNSFGMTLHTNGNLYLMDNGPNAGFGDYSLDCNGKTKPAQNIPDKFFLIQKGKYHGHPNLNRRECEHYPSSAVRPLLDNVKSSTDGVLEYRSNTFGGAIKGNVFLSMFAAQFEGQMGQVKLSGDGRSVASFAPNFLGFSGIAVAEGPRGEIMMARVYKNFMVIARPKFAKPRVTFVIGVHPKYGPASGGASVTVNGFNFGLDPKVTFGGKSCVNVRVIDDESLTCTTPANSKNTQVSVVVTGKTGPSPTYGRDYWYW